MSVQTEIDRISTAVQNAHLKVIEKGGTSAAPYLVANLPDAIDTIPEAPTLDELTNPGSADTMLEGTEMLDAEGKKVTGAIPNKTADDLTANGAKVSVPAGYYAEDTEKSVSTAFLAKPSINVGADGLITASYKQWGGYVQSGTQETTRQLPTQDTMTVTPGKSGQVAVKAGKYTTGDVYVAGDSDLIPDNIKSGVSIFGVAGTMTAGEDVTAETETYTDLLTDLEAAVDALPDAGSGGAAVETCSIRLVCASKDIYGYSYLAYRNGAFVPVSVTNEAAYSSLDVTLTDVICNGYIYVQTRISSGMEGASVTGDATCEFISVTSRSSNLVAIVYAPSSAGSESTVTIVDYD